MPLVGKEPPFDWAFVQRELDLPGLSVTALYLAGLNTRVGFGFRDDGLSEFQTDPIV